MEAGTIGSWAVKEGDTFSAGQVMFSVGPSRCLLARASPVPHPCLCCIAIASPVTHPCSILASKVIAEIETDKATMGFEAQDPGVVAKILVAAGTEIKVGTPIMITVDSADEV